MANEVDPVVEQWYTHLDKGQRFFVTAVDESGDSVEVQHFDGDVEEFTFEEWRDLDIESCEAPENWSGAYDLGEVDDLGTEITDTSADDWADPQREFRKSDEQRAGRESHWGADETGEGFMEESSIE